MSDGITDAERMKNTEIAIWREKVIDEALPEISTEKLVAELCKRDDVTHYYETFTNFRHHIIVVKES